MDILDVYYNDGNTLDSSYNCNINALLDPFNECTTYIQRALFPVITGDLKEMEEAAVQMQVA